MLTYQKTTKNDQQELLSTYKTLQINSLDESKLYDVIFYQQVFSIAILLPC